MLLVDDELWAKLEKNVAHIEDVRGLNCPMPILRTKKALAKMAEGEFLKILTTDKAAVTDLAVFAKQTGHVLMAQQATDNGVVVHFIQRRKS